MFNTFNHTNFNSVDTDVDDGTAFGTLNGTHTPRNVQLGLKLYFSQTFNQGHIRSRVCPFFYEPRRQMPRQPSCHRTIFARNTSRSGILRPRT